MQYPVKKIRRWRKQTKLSYTIKSYTEIYIYIKSELEKKMSLMTADTLKVCPKVLGSCVGVKVDSRLGPTLTNQGLV